MNQLFGNVLTHWAVSSMVIGSFISIHLLFTLAVDIPQTKPIISYCGGQRHACAVFDTMQMKCWGTEYDWGKSNSSTRTIGDSPSTVGDVLPFIEVGTNLNITEVFCGSQHTCVKLQNKSLKCLGGNAMGQVGVGSISNPIGFVTGFSGDKLPVVNLGTGLQVLDVTLGGFFSCAILTGNKVKCFGYNKNGQLGLGGTVNKGTSASDMGNSLPYVNLGTGVEVSLIQAGTASNHICAILSKPVGSEQRFKCWGHNDYYQLGYGDTYDRGTNATSMGDNLLLVDLGTESKVKQFALGGIHTCALLVSDGLKCWGRGAYGQLASGAAADISKTGNSIPLVAIDSGKTVKQITAGYQHSCILYDDMLTMKCVGYNGIGQLGQGDITTRGNTPSTTLPKIKAIQLGTGSLKISSISAGYGHNCVIFASNFMKCFGENEYGQLAVGSSSNVGDSSSEMGNKLLFSVLFSPIVQCNYSDAKGCNGDIKCTWKKTKAKGFCDVIECSKLSREECNKKKKKCSWSVQGPICIPIGV